MAIGKVIQIIGPVIDCEFDRTELPRINEAIRINKRSIEGQPVITDEEPGSSVPAKDAMKLLLSSSEQQAHELALSLKQKNDERKGICSKAEADAVNYVKENLTEDTKVIILYMENVHGVCAGLLQAALKKHFIDQQ